LQVDSCFVVSANGSVGNEGMCGQARLEQRVSIDIAGVGIAGVSKGERFIKDEPNSERRAIRSAKIELSTSQMGTEVEQTDLTVRAIGVGCPDFRAVRVDDQVAVALQRQSAWALST